MKALISCVTLLLVSSSLWANDCYSALSNIQLKRFAPHLKELDPVLRMNPNEISEALVAKDYRYNTFMIQGLLRIYERVYGRKAGNLRLEIKTVEDAIGDYKAQAEFYAFALELHLPPKVIKHMKKKVGRYKNLLTDTLLEYGWISFDADAELYIVEYAKKLAGIKWHDPEQDLRDVAGSIATEMKKIEKKEYDMEELQEGIHKLRRKMRWILIYVQSLRGLILLEDSKNALPINEYRKLETHPEFDNQYTRIPENPDVIDPIIIPRSYYLALTKYSDDLDEIKSLGENLHAVTEAFLRTGRAASLKAAEGLALQYFFDSSASDGFEKLEPGEFGRFHEEQIIQPAIHVYEEIKRAGVWTAIRKILENAAQRP
jgi:hypothetical protein